MGQRTEITADLFAPQQPAAVTQVMSVLDEINTKWGRGRCDQGGWSWLGMGYEARHVEPKFYDPIGSAMEGRVQIVSPLGMRQMGHAPI